MTTTSRPWPWHLYSLTMRMLLRAKIWCDERIALMSLISPLALSVNWMVASPRYACLKAARR